MDKAWSVEVRVFEMYKVVRKLKEMKKLLKHLNKERYNNLHRRTEKARAELDECHSLLQIDQFNVDLLRREVAGKSM